MEDATKRLIEQQYGFIIKTRSIAPRQYVAETFIIETTDHEVYFCKIVTKPLFIPKIIKSLPILLDMHHGGATNINFPIKTKNGQLYIHSNGVLIILFNYISAPQSYDYDMNAYGKLLASIHALTPSIHMPIPTEQFIFTYEDRYTKQVESLLKTPQTDPITTSLQTLLQHYEREMRHDYDNFIQLSKELRVKKHTMVVTHGDPGGNILAQSPKNLYLIDWDDILLSPPERDIWFTQHNTDFLEGYHSVIPDYNVNIELAHFFTYKRYFEDIMEYFTEIFGNYSVEHRQENLDKLKQDCFEGWLRPSIRAFDPYH